MRSSPDDLNPEQRRAVEHAEGPLLVLAGAGSGKTRVLTTRIATLLARHRARPEEVLAVTFTNKAAGEMRERVGRLLGGSAGALTMGTFHSVCARWLRRHIERLRLGYDRSFAIYDAADQLGVLEKAIEGRPFSVSARLLLARIDQAKNDGLDDVALLESAESPLDVAAAEAYGLYQQALRRNNTLDFGDLLLLTLTLFQRSEEALAEVRDRFRYVHVDEYQDTNRVQYQCLHLIASQHRNLCAVGDEDQSIYGWRGANIRNILEFEQDYPDATVIRLEQNYRSTGNILAVADAVIRNNRDRKGKTLWTRNPDGGRPVLIHAADERSEARIVADEIERLSRSRKLGDFVVFYRTNAQSRVFEEECLRRGLPYALVGGVRFYERKEIKDVLAYLRVVANPADEWSLLRVVNVPPRGIGAVTVGRLVAASRERSRTLFDVLLAPPPDVSREIRKRVSEFAEALQRLREDHAAGSVSALVEAIFEATGYWA
ncbi:MAG: ATP-dependent helicase, partial [Candidatus Binatia bacterium]